MGNARNRAENEKELQLVTAAAAAAAFLPAEGEPLAESVGLCEEGDVGRVVRPRIQWSARSIFSSPLARSSLLAHTHFLGGKEIKKERTIFGLNQSGPLRFQGI